ncbi:MAG TPA: DNA adenine methylase [Verrucomicrobiota bacterium]|nr:DNA adenine methylase [Verrucomicrobiota bacterium]
MPFVAAPGVNREAQPFLKWVGGKAQLLTQFDKFFPTEITRYSEPFIGGGAVFFYLKHRFPRMRAFLRDINPELINTYRAVQEFPRELMHQLDAHTTEFKTKGTDYFYFVRAQHHLAGDESKIVERAARMIFLNKTCFNGLWRVNARGEFNVPVGSNKNPGLYNEANILAASRALEGSHLAVQDFRETINQAQSGDFVYVDPPYYPVSVTASFTSYAKEDFGEGEQRELHAVFAEAARRGVRLMLSNSDTPFIRKLYRDFQIRTVQARRAINCDGSKRGQVNEVVVTNIPNE